MKKICYFTQLFKNHQVIRMKKIYLLILLIVTSFCAYAQNGSDRLIIKRDILGAENLSDSVEQKKQVIAAARSSKSAEDLPVTVYVVTHDDIILHGYTTLCDVLKNVPGIRVSQPAGSDLGEGFMMRGMTGNIYSKILINDVNIKPSGVTGMPLGADIPVRQAERIEIIYGPASASYGNDACVGVIHIVTMKPDNGNYTSADLMVGTGNRSYLNFNTGTKLGHGRNVAELSFYGTNLALTDMNLPDESFEIYNRWNYFKQNGSTFSFSGADGNIYNISDNMITKEMFEKYRELFSDMNYYFVNYEGNKDDSGSENDGFYKPDICKRPQRASQIGVEMKFKEWSFSYNMLHRMDYTNHGVSPFTYNYEDPNALYGEYIHRFVLAGDWATENFSNNMSLSLLHYRMDENSCRTVNWDKNYQYFYGASDDISIEDNISWQPLDKLFINAGASFTYSGILPKTIDYVQKFDFTKYKMFSKDCEDFRYNVLDTFGLYPYTSYSAGAYVQADYSFGPVSLVGGVRYDYMNYDYSSRYINKGVVEDYSLNPRVAAFWKITDKTSFRASQAYAYKAPSPNMKFYTVAVIMEGALPTGQSYTAVAYHHLPSVSKLTPEKISATEFGLRHYFNKTNYLELVGYTNRVKDPLIRRWVSIGEAKQDGLLIENPAYIVSGVSNFTDPSKDRKYTRSYANVKDAKTKLYGIQVIGVAKNIFKPINLNVSGALTLSSGEEMVPDNSATTDTVLVKLDNVRGVPKAMVQVSLDFDFSKIFHVRLDNTYCSKTQRIYYIGLDNGFFWSPSYYNLDVALSIKMTKNLSGLVKVSNLTNTLYGGMDALTMDVDLAYNPQLLRTFSFGVTYNF